MTEIDLRKSVVSVMEGWLGYSEADGRHKQIIDLYNTQRPLPRGYKVQYTDEWCAATVTAAGIAAGLSDIIFGECSCSAMISLYKAAGRWIEADDFTPRLGDIIMYDWNDTGNGDDVGAPEHVGIVSNVVGNSITVIEGNKNSSVAKRYLQINGKYIRGYCVPDYKSKAAECMSVDEAKAIVKEKVNLSDETMQYLWCYRFGDELLIKLATALKN